MLSPDQSTPSARTGTSRHQRGVKQCADFIIVLSARQPAFVKSVLDAIESRDSRARIGARATDMQFFMEILEQGAGMPLPESHRRVGNAIRTILRPYDALRRFKTFPEVHVKEFAVPVPVGGKRYVARHMFAYRSLDEALCGAVEQWAADVDSGPWLSGAANCDASGSFPESKRGKEICAAARRLKLVPPDTLVATYCVGADETTTTESTMFEVRVKPLISNRRDRTMPFADVASLAVRNQVQMLDDNGRVVAEHVAAGAVDELKAATSELRMTEFTFVFERMRELASEDQLVSLGDRTLRVRFAFGLLVADMQQMNEILGLRGNFAGIGSFTPAFTYHEGFHRNSDTIRPDGGGYVTYPKDRTEVGDNAAISRGADAAAHAGVNARASQATLFKMEPGGICVTPRHLHTPSDFLHVVGGLSVLIYKVLHDVFGSRMATISQRDGNTALGVAKDERKSVTVDRILAFLPTVCAAVRCLAWLTRNSTTQARRARLDPAKFAVRLAVALLRTWQLCSDAAPAKLGVELVAASDMAKEAIAGFAGFKVSRAARGSRAAADAVAADGAVAPDGDDGPAVDEVEAEALDLATEDDDVEQPAAAPGTTAAARPKAPLFSYAERLQTAKMLTCILRFHRDAGAMGPLTAISTALYEVLNKRTKTNAAYATSGRPVDRGKSLIQADAAEDIARIVKSLASVSHAANRGETMVAARSARPALWASLRDTGGKRRLHLGQSGQSEGLEAASLYCAKAAEHALRRAFFPNLEDDDVDAVFTIAKNRICGLTVEALSSLVMGGNHRIVEIGATLDLQVRAGSAVLLEDTIDAPAALRDSHAVARAKTPRAFEQCGDRWCLPHSDIELGAPETCAETTLIGLPLAAARLAPATGEAQGAARGPVWVGGAQCYLLVLRLRALDHDLREHYKLVGEYVSWAGQDNIDKMSVLAVPATLVRGSRLFVPRICGDKTLDVNESYAWVSKVWGRQLVSLY